MTHKREEKQSIFKDKKNKEDIFQMESSVALLTVLGLTPSIPLTASFATRRLLLFYGFVKLIYIYLLGIKSFKL